MLSQHDQLSLPHTLHVLPIDIPIFNTSLFGLYHITPGLSLKSIGNIQTILKKQGGNTGVAQQVGAALKSLEPEIQKRTLLYSGLSEEMMRTALMEAGLSEADAAAQASMIAAESAAMSFSGGLKKLGTNIKNTAKGLLTFLTTNPAGILISVAGAAQR